MYDTNKCTPIQEPDLASECIAGVHIHACAGCHCHHRTRQVLGRPGTAEHTFSQLILGASLILVARLHLHPGFPSSCASTGQSHAFVLVADALAATLVSNDWVLSFGCALRLGWGDLAGVLWSLLECPVDVVVVVDLRLWSLAGWSALGSEELLSVVRGDRGRQ